MDVRRLPLPSEPLLTVVASCRQQGRGLLDLWSLPVKLPSGPVVDGSFCDYALARLGRYQP